MNLYDPGKSTGAKHSDDKVMAEDLRKMNEAYMKNYESTRQSKINKWLFIMLVFLLITVAIQFYLLHEKSGISVSSQPDSKPENNLVVPPEISIQDWDPFEEFQRMQKKMDQFFQNDLPGFDSSIPNLKSFSFGGRASQTTKIEDTEDHYIVTVDLPGLDQTQLDVRVQEQSLNISGSMEFVEETKQEQGIIKNQRSQHFERYFTLPGPVKPTTLKVDYENSRLIITIDKLQT